jgi:type I restriction enzyme S subunit
MESKNNGKLSMMNDEITTPNSQFIIKSVPQLRFPEFMGEWSFITLGDLGKVSMCKRILKEQTSFEGEIPFYKIGTFGKQADSFISKNLYEDYKKK